MEKVLIEVYSSRPWGYDREYAYKAYFCPRSGEVIETPAGTFVVDKIRHVIEVDDQVSKIEVYGARV